MNAGVALERLSRFSEAADVYLHASEQFGGISEKAKKLQYSGLKLRAHILFNERKCVNYSAY